MKYVNPDSTHPLDLHSEDKSLEASSSFATQSFTPRQAILLAAGVGAIAFLSAFVVRRRSIRSLQVDDLKIGNLEVDRLRIKNHERPTSMEETGGILRFELGPSDVYENGLE